MVETLQEVQVLFLAFVLLTACLAKLAIRSPEYGATFGMLRGQRPVAITVIVVEGALGIMLLVTPHPSARLGTAIFFAIATSVVGELRMRRPDVGCGCFGGLSSTPVRLRSLARPVLLAVAAVAALEVPVSGLAVLRSLSDTHALLLAVEVVVFAALSPEVGVTIDRLRRQVPCELREQSLRETYGVLRASAAWRAHVDRLVADEPAEVWRERCWRFVVYPGKIDERPVDVVFAVYLEGRRPPVRVGVVDAETAAASDLDITATPPGTLAPANS